MCLIKTALSATKLRFQRRAAERQQYGYEWCLTGDKVNFYVVPDNGKELKSVIVNGVDRTESVKNGQFSVNCNGDIEIVAEFE